jgi:DNA mismatch endonuclease, patch repair protein
MADVHTRKQRSFNMSRIRSRDTRPEMIVRSLVHRLGYRYCLHKKDLPGKPDLVLVRHNKIIDVYGCFFHMHKCKYGLVTPATNRRFWQQKRMSNVTRDRRNQLILRRNGWHVMVVWECETRNLERLEKRLVRFLHQSFQNKRPIEHHENSSSGSTPASLQRSMAGSR